jgi:hypothetical protein
MTVKDVKEKYVGQYATIEVYRYNDLKINVEFHTDNLNYVEDYTDDMELENDWSYELMDDEQYNNSIDANCKHIPFSELYDEDDPKVLCIIVK